jgi:hypothetical protein
MEFILIFFLIGLVIGILIFMRRPGPPPEDESVEATFVCDVCGENECICRRTDEG